MPATTSKNEPSRALIDQYVESVFAPMAMLAAMQLGVFTPLAEGPMTAPELAADLDADAANLAPLLYELVVANLLTCEADRFSNTAVADRFLVPGKPDFIGRAYERWKENWIALLGTEQIVRTGKPHAKTEFLAMSEDDLMVFLRGLHDTTINGGRALAAEHDFSQFEHIVDIAGGAGGLSVALCQEYPELRATVVELPAVTPTTSKFIAEASLEDRIGVQAADLLSEDLPGEYDAALVKSFIQVLSPGQAAIALRRIGAALRTDGRIFILGRILNDDRVSPAFTVGFNLVFVNIYDDGRAYTEGEYRSWLETAGFTDVAAKEFRGGDVLITARKV